MGDTIEDSAVAAAPSRTRAASATTATTNRRPALVFASAAVVAALGFLVAYRHFGFDADSVAYVGVARNVASGHGITYPFRSPGARMTDFPPGYPVVLAAGHAVGFSVVTFARLFQALMLGVAAALAAYLVLRASGSVPFAAGAFFLIVAAPGLDEIFSVVYSEPIAIALQLGALVLLAVWATNRRWPALIGAGVCAALSPVVRWVGVSVIVAGAIVVAIYAAGPVARKLRLAALWGGACFVPLLVVALANRNAGHSGNGTARQLAWHPVQWSQLKVGFDTVGSWLLPRQLHDRWVVGLVLVVIALSALGALASRRGTPAARRAFERGGPAVAAPTVFVVVYTITLLISMTLFDAATPLDVRLLSPLYAALVPALVGAVAAWYVNGDHRADVARGVFAVCAIVLVLVGVRALTTATGSQDSRLGYASAHWHRSPVMRQITALPQRAWVVTNAPEAVYLQTGRPARGLPSKFSSTSLARQANYAQNLSRLIAQTRAHHGEIAMFDEVKGRPWLPKAAELEHDPQLRVVARVGDGVVLMPSQ